MLKERFKKDIEYIAEISQPQTLQRFTFVGELSFVPASLLAIWEQFGIASWDDGAFQTCDPHLLRPAIDVAVYGFLEPHDVVPFIVSAFGVVKAWHRQYGVFEINYPFAKIVLSAAPDDLLKKQMGDINFISRFPKSRKDFPHIEGFDAVRKKLGRLDLNELYGFVPALALGGSPGADNAKKLVADNHLDFLSQMRPFEFLFFTSSGYKPI